MRDAAILLGVIAGHDPLDATSAELPVPDYVQALDQPVKGLRVGVPAEYFGDGLDAEVRAAVESAIERLREAGCSIHPVSLPHTRYAVPTYYLVATAEASANLARFDGVRYGFRAKDANTLTAMYRQSRDMGFGAEVKRRILLGTYALSAGYYDAYYKKAQQVRTLLTRDFLAAFEQVDVLVTPTAPTPAFKLGEKTDDPLSMYLADIYTVTASLAGICGISVPCGKSSQGLPIGAQILGKHFDEATVLRAALAVENAVETQRLRERLVVSLLRRSAGEAERLPLAHQETVVVDAFSALSAGHALALVSGKFSGVERHLHPLLVEQVVVAHLAVGGHLLQVLVFYFRVQLPSQRPWKIRGRRCGWRDGFRGRRRLPPSCPSREI